MDARRFSCEESKTRYVVNGGDAMEGCVVDFGKLLNEAIAAAMRELGHVNILVAGRSGYGKSTLINSVFQSHLAAVGQGRPVTTKTREFSKEGVPISIWDTRGLELADFDNTLSELAKVIRERNSERDPGRHIHVAWLCIQEDVRRLDDAEIRLHERLSQLVPVLAVITKARNDAGFRQKVQDLLPHAKNVVRVRSIVETLDDGHTLSPMGLEQLVFATAELVPEGQRRAFAASQKASVEYKKTVSRRVVVAFSTSAAGIVATPIPFADALLLVPNQVAMLATISATFGLDLTKTFLATLAASAAGSSGATFLGRSLVVNVLKLIPGAGSAAGALIGATTASGLTAALGELYIQVLAELFERHAGEPPSADEVARAFEKRLPGDH
jgi:uncharacterized protein (DUF697 family)